MFETLGKRVEKYIQYKWNNKWFPFVHTIYYGIGKGIKIELLN